MQKFISCVVISFVLALFNTGVAVSATNDIVFSEDITVTGVTLGSGTTDMTVFASSSAESFDFSAGVFTVTDPGSTFRVGSSNGDVDTLVILKDGAMESCALNSTPGTSSTTLPTASGTYTIRPLEADDCDNLCTALTGAATYNAYPTCGAATCSSGYNVSGSGASATCVAASSGGGGGGSLPHQDDEDDSSDTTQSYQTSSDGTEIVSEVTTQKEGSKIVEVKNETTITPTEDIEDDQTVSLDSSDTADIKKIELELDKMVLKELVDNAESAGEIKVNITSREASSVQKSDTARGGNFLVGYDVFTINIAVDGEAVTQFDNPITLTFDISDIKEGRSSLKAYYFDEEEDKWVMAGNGGSISGNELIVILDHLTDIGLIRDVEDTEEPEVEPVVTNDRDAQIMQIEDDANVVFVSGSDLEMILLHNNVAKNVEAQIHGMNNYIPNLTEGVSGLTINEIYAINNFVTYGSITTRILGAGERAGVVNSYKKAFGKLPRTESEWRDCIAIGNGRWPGETSQSAEDQAKAEFKRIYLKDANMDNPNDNAAVTVIAYGLRPSDRNLDSEAAAIRIFKGIYQYNPTSALDWDIVRAIAYSGATR